MPARVSPTDRVRAKIDELFASDRELPEILEEVARLGAQLLMQAALEAEVTEFLGRDRYQRSATAPDARSGARNGYRPATVKTTAGPITLERPKLRGGMRATAPSRKARKLTALAVGAITVICSTDESGRAWARIWLPRPRTRDSRARTAAPPAPIRRSRGG